MNVISVETDRDGVAWVVFNNWRQKYNLLNPPELRQLETIISGLTRKPRAAWCSSAPRRTCSWEDRILLNYPNSATRKPLKSFLLQGKGSSIKWPRCLCRLWRRLTGDVRAAALSSPWLAAIG